MSIWTSASGFFCFVVFWFFVSFLRQGLAMTSLDSLSVPDWPQFCDDSPASTSQVLRFLLLKIDFFFKKTNGSRRINI